MLQRRLERLSIGDSLVSPDGNWQVDYVDPSDVDNPGYAVCRGREIHLLTPGDEAGDLDTVAEFLDSRVTGDPRDWQFRRSGSDTNPLWDWGIGQFSLSYPEYFTKLSPHTFALRTQATVAARRNHTPVVEGGAIVAVRTRKCRGSLVTDDIHFQINKVMALKASASDLTTCFVQIRGIKHVCLGTLKRDHLEAEGFTTWAQFKYAWVSGKNGQYLNEKMAWVITLAPVYTALPPAEYEIAAAVPESGMPVVFEWRQLALPLAIGG